MTGNFYLSWHNKIGISIYFTGLILITIGIFLATFGAVSFKYVIALLVFIFEGIDITGILFEKIPNLPSKLINIFIKN